MAHVKTAMTSPDLREMEKSAGLINVTSARNLLKMAPVEIAETTQELKVVASYVKLMTVITGKRS